MWGLTLGDLPTIAGTIVTLVLLEGLLSADNALVLAVMVQHLPRDQQKRALRYGIWGAFIFRAIAVAFAYQLIQYWQLKLAGGLYLLFISIKHFLSDSHAAEGDVRRPRRGAGLVATIINVELADIAFSIDSILAAVALVEALPPRLQQNTAVALSIIYVGGVLGIVMMRLVAGFFLVLLNKYHGLAAGAYVLVGWIGLKLVGGGIHSALHGNDSLLWNSVLPAFTGGIARIATRGTPFDDWRDRIPEWVRELPWELPDWAFWVGMLLIIVVSVAYKPSRKASREEQAPDQRETA